jgi:hypothetical protein
MIVLTVLSSLACAVVAAVLLGDPSRQPTNTRPAVRLELTDWAVCSPSLGCFPAKVPGHALLDAIRLGRGDPYFEFTEQNLSRLSFETWTYQARIIQSALSPIASSELRDDDKRRVCQLYFEQIDTVATVKVNGVTLNATRTRSSLTDNAFLPYSFQLPTRHVDDADVTAVLLVQVEIQSSLNYSRWLAQTKYKSEFYPHTINYNVWSEPTHRNLLRKPASEFGWVR